MVAGSEEVHICDAANFEILLRFQRAARRAGIATRPLADLAGFLAQWQDFGTAWNEDRALAAIERLAGHAAPVKVWLNDVLPARFGAFADSAFDALMARSGLQWLGTGTNAITLCYPEDVALLRRSASPTPVAEQFRDPHARYSWHQLADAANNPGFDAALWEAVWAGAVSTDALHTLRAGLASGFELPAFDGSRRALRGRAAGWPGNWMLNPTPEPEPDPLTALEDARERARRLVDRYGVVCREFVNREGAGREIYRALRLMELAGEVVAGLFFEGLSGPQFASPRAIASLRRYQAPRAHWVNATDCAAPCGLGIDLAGLPHRRSGNYLAFVAGRLALAVENSGRRLQFHLDPDDDALDLATAVLVHIARSERRFAVETINGEAARSSPYLDALDRVLVRTSDHRNLWFETR
jgi:ATP-dependent Lhr-like helicase